MAPFALVSIQYTTLTRLTLTFNDTLDATAPANINPANYVLSGDAIVAGNFSIQGSTVSFDVTLAFPGRVYDITVSNVVSTQAAVIAPGSRLSFFFGIGSITPFLVESFVGLGSLYIISDSALVGPVIPTGSPTYNRGVLRGKSVVRSYNPLLEAIPTGGFFNIALVTVPYHTLLTDLLLISGFPGLSFGLYINDVFVGSAISNFEGWVAFQVHLPVGTATLKILRSDSTNPYLTELAHSKLVSWIGAIADSFEKLDSSVDQVRDARAIERVRSDDIQANFGAFVKTPRVSNYSLDIYREVLIEVIQAFRYYSATLEGLAEVVAAFTQIRPILKWSRTDRPRWILGWQHLLNREMTERIRYAVSSLPATNIVATSANSSNENGATASIYFDPGPNTIQYASVGDALGAAQTIVELGSYTLISANGIDTLTVTVGSPLPGVATTLAVTITGPAFPSGVVLENATVNIVGNALFHTNGLRLKATATGADPTVIMKADPTTFQHLGELFVASFWVRHDLGSNRDFITEVSEDGGVTWLPGSVAVTVPDGTPTRVDTTRSLGYFGVDDIKVRLRGVTVVATESFYLEKAALHSPQTGALYLSRNTIPRNRRRKFFSYLLLMFLRESLEIQAYTILGLKPALGWGIAEWGSSPYGSPSYGFFQPVLENASTARIGLIPFIVPTQVEIDTFQDSLEASDDSGIVNVRGVVYEADWRTGTAINMDVIPRSLDRFTHLKPSTVSNREETILFNGSGLAALSRVSLSIPAQSRLLKNGVPLANDTWNYADTTHIQLVSLLDLDQSAVYKFSYSAELSFASNVIDLGVKFDLFNWYADWYEYSRVDLVPANLFSSEAVNFSVNSLLAVLSQRADVTASGTTLYQNNHKTTVPVSTTLWRFIDPATIKIDSSAFDSNSIYSIEYVAQSLVKKPTTNVVVEVQYSVDNLIWSAWVTIDHDAPFGSRFRYFRYRIQVYNVGDLRDYKLRSMTLKGDPLDRTTIQPLV